MLEQVKQENGEVKELRDEKKVFDFLRKVIFYRDFYRLNTIILGSKNDRKMSRIGVKNATICGDFGENLEFQIGWNVGTKIA